MSTLDDFYSLRNTLFKMGQLETLCFTLTMSGDWWFIQNDVLIYSHWTETGKCDVMIDFWGS